MDLKRSLDGVKITIQKPIEDHGIITPAIGVTTGLISGGFLSETMARALGYIGYKKAAVKTGVKVALGGLMIGTGLGFPVTNPILYPAAIANFGMIPLDWIDAKWSGGITGLSERAAVVIRTWSMGVEKVQEEMNQLSKLSPNVIIETGGEVHLPYENSHTPAKSELVGAPLSKNHATPPAAMSAERPLDMRLTKS